VTLFRASENEPSLLYAAVDSFDPDRSRVFDGMERMAAEGAVGFKFYPSNGFFDRDANRLVKMFYDDPDKSYPFFEKARSLGIKHVAFHKTMSVGPGPTDAAHVEDVSTAAAMFPDMTFEIVHSGWAFLEECALQLKLHSNVYANLECVANLVVRQPRRFAHIIGTMLLHAEPERILFAKLPLGVCASRPRSGGGIPLSWVRGLGNAWRDRIRRTRARCACTRYGKPNPRPFISLPALAT
jgi:predicted TIM-barrel fold metal-dependent hydrolase